MTPADGILYLARSIAAWLIIVSGRPPLGVSLVYLALFLAWWLYSMLPKPPRGIPLNDNGRTRYIEVDKIKV